MPGKQDEMLCELETDKVSVEVPAPAAGVLAEIVAPEGTTGGRRWQAGGAVRIWRGIRRTCGRCAGRSGGRRDGRQRQGCRRRALGEKGWPRLACRAMPSPAPAAMAA
ncbi:MAG: biotin/lipoyl-containing protein [Paracoccaceae bacterium]